MKRVLGICVATAMVLLAVPSKADSGPDPTGWWLMTGILLADGVHDGPNGFVAGIEASVVRNARLPWVGGYVDLVHEFREGQGARASFGPELGFGPLGLDTGFLLAFDETVREGFVVRPMLTLGFVSVVGRVGHLFGSDSETYGEVGLLLKLPLQIGHVGESDQ